MLLLKKSINELSCKHSWPLAFSLKIFHESIFIIMKKMLLGLSFLVSATLLIQENTAAQVRVGVNINIGDQPRWRDPGYDYVEYYYLPDIQTYYYVPRHQFVYMSNGRWVFSASLPSRYRDYDLYSGYKVVVNRPNAYYYYNEHRRQYAPKVYYKSKGYKRHDNGRHNGWKKHRH